MLNTEVLNETVASGNQEILEEEIDLSSVLDEEEDAEVRPSEVDAETLLSADLSATRILTRPEEETLGRKIARARGRVRAILRKARRLTRAALPDGGRGVIDPQHDFREREAVTILRYAQRALREAGLREPGLARATGLGRKQLRAFVTELSAALADYRVVRDQMVRANVRLVNVLARRYRHPSLTFLDLFQEGTVGLLRAIEKYDPDRNIKFSTYATWWIWQQLGRAADTQGALIRTPVHWNQFRRQLSRDQQELAGENDGPVSREELAANKGMEVERLETMAQTFHYVSTDTPLSGDDDRVLETTLAGDGTEPEEQTFKTALRKQLEVALNQLPARERSILQRRFGWEDDNAETLDEIGTTLGVSRERIRQLESRALKRLKDVCSAQGLHEYLH